MNYLARGKKEQAEFMMVRIAKGVWLISLFAAVAGLLHAYASLPDNIQISDAEGQTVERSQLFYAVLGLLAVFNAMVFVVNRLMAVGDEFFQAWFYGLIVFFNVFILVSVQFFNVYNSAEKFDYDSIGFIIYGSVSLIILWASLWPILRLVRMFRPKQEIGS